jgi:hypothetical protein
LTVFEVGSFMRAIIIEFKGEMIERSYFKNLGSQVKTCESFIMDNLEKWSIGMGNGGYIFPWLKKKKLKISHYID